MFKRERVLVFIGLHLTFLIALVGTLQSETYVHNSMLNLWYPLIIYLIGLSVYSIMYGNKSAFFFYMMLTIIGLALSTAPSRVTYVLVHTLPFFLYAFCIEFFQIDESRIPRFLTGSIALLTVVTMCCYAFVQLLFEYFLLPDFLLFSHLTVGALSDLLFLCFLSYVLCAIMILASKNKNMAVLKSSKMLIVVLAIVAVPYIMVTILGWMMPAFPIKNTDMLYLFLALPITVGYILLEESSIIIYYDKKEIARVVALSVFLLCASIAFMMLVLGISEKEVVLILMSALFGIYLFTAMINYVSRNKVDNINENLYENRKTELMYQLKFQELLNNYIIFVLHQLRYSGYPHAFISTRRHARIELFDENNLVSIEGVTKYFNQIMREGTGEFIIDGVAYLVIVFLKRVDEQGFLAVRQETVPLETLQVDTSEYLILLEKIYDLEFLKQNYKSLPGVRPQEFIIEKYHYEINRIQQEESQYLHDVALQKMLTIKNFLEIIEIPNVEFKEYLLSEIRELNASLITHMYDLFPFTLKNLSLYECICELMTRLKKTKEYQMNYPRMHLVMNKTLKVPRYFFYPIYSFIKQLLWNVFAFADATLIEIQLSVENDEIIIKITDNGNRANMQDLISQEDNRKNGILIINYEVKELNGQLFTELHYPKGSIITIKLPYKEEVTRWR